MKLFILSLFIIFHMTATHSKVAYKELNIPKDKWLVLNSTEFIKKNITVIFKKKNQEVRGFLLRSIAGLVSEKINISQKTRDVCKVKGFQGRIHKHKHKSTCILSKTDEKNTIKLAVFFTLLKLKDQEIIVKNTLTFSDKTSTLSPYIKDIEDLLTGLQL